MVGVRFYRTELNSEGAQVLFMGTSFWFCRRNHSAAVANYMFNKSISRNGDLELQKIKTSKCNIFQHYFKLCMKYVSRIESIEFGI